MLTTLLYIAILLFFENVTALTPIKKSETLTLFNIPSQTNIYTQYLKASYLHNRGEVNKSLAIYSKLLEDKKASIFIFDGYIRALSDASKYETIAHIYEQKKNLFSSCFAHNLELNMIFAQAFLMTNQDQKAELLFNNLTKQHPNNPQICYYNAICLLKSNKFKECLAFLNNCINNATLRNKQYLFYFLQSKVFFQTNNFQDAFIAINKSLELFPNFDRGILFKAILLEQQGKIREAIDGYKKFLDITGRDLSIEKQLIQLLFSEERFSEAVDYLKKNPHEDPAYYFDLALTQMRAQQYTEGLNSVERSLTLQPNFNKAKLLKIELLLNAGRTTDVLNYMQGWISHNTNDEAALHSFLLLKKTSITLDQLIKTLEIISINTPSLLIHATLGDLYTEAKRYSESITEYKKAFNLTTDNTTKSSIMFHISYLYFLAKDYTNLEKSCSQAIKNKQANPATYNLLAYHYSKKHDKLTAALSLINKALTLEPNNNSFLDTKGCILSKMGKKNEAINLLQQAHKQDPSDNTIKRHLKTTQSPKQ